MESNQSIFSALPIELSARIMSEAGNPYASLVSKEFNAYFQETNKCVLLKLLKYLPEELSSQSNLRITKKIEKKISKESYSNIALLNLLYNKLLGAANKPFVPLQGDYSTGIISVAISVYERDVIQDENLLKIWNMKLADLFNVKDLNLKTPNEIRDWLCQNKDKVNKVESLDIRDCKLDCLPREICTFSGIKVLYLDYNNLQALPPEIGKLSNLRTFRCISNKLLTLPNQIGKLKCLVQLHVSENSITSIPDSISHLSSLAELTLHNNKLSRVPHSIGLLSKLTLLRLDRNLLQRLPSEIGGLSSLKILLLEDNRLTSIPSEIGSLSCLERLRLNDNKLTTLPSELKNLTRIEEFDISNNPFDHMPLELARIIGSKRILE